MESSMIAYLISGLVLSAVGAATTCCTMYCILCILKHFGIGYLNQDFDREEHEIIDTKEQSLENLPSIHVDSNTCQADLIAFRESSMSLSKAMEVTTQELSNEALFNDEKRNTENITDKPRCLVFGFVRQNFGVAVNDISSIIYNLLFNYHINNAKYSKVAYNLNNSIICSFKEPLSEGDQSRNTQNTPYSTVIFQPFLSQTTKLFKRLRMRVLMVRDETKLMIYECQRYNFQCGLIRIPKNYVNYTNFNDGNDSSMDTPQKTFNFYDLSSIYKNSNVSYSIQYNTQGDTLYPFDTFDSHFVSYKFNFGSPRDFVFRECNNMQMRNIEKKFELDKQRDVEFFTNDYIDVCLGYDESKDEYMLHFAKNDRIVEHNKHWGTISLEFDKYDYCFALSSTANKDHEFVFEVCFDCVFN